MSWVEVKPTAGVVKTREAANLALGEAVSVSNARLKPGDTEQLHNDVGSQTFDTVSGTVVAGPFYLSFEGSADKLLVVTTSGGTSYLETATVGTSGSFASIQTISGTVTAAWVVHRGDEYFVGTDRGNYVVKDNASRAMGMEAPASPNTSTGNAITVAATTGSNLSAGDCLVYWATEYDSVNDIESGPIWIDAVTIQTSGNEVLQHRLDNSSYSALNSTTDKVRIYRHYTGNAWSSGAFDSTLPAFQDTLRYKGQKTALIGGLLTEQDWGTGDYTYSVTDKFNQSPTYPLVLTDNQGTAIYEYLDQPDSFTLGCVYNDSLVVNAPGTSKQVIKYSPPGAPEYQPVPYFMYFATERSDEIVGLSVVNNRLLVLLTGSAHRVNYLPTEGNVAAQQGRVQETIGNVGCVGRQAWAKVETSHGELLVWLSNRGLEWSNGLGWADACPDFTADILEGTLANAVLVNNRKLYRLELYSGTERYDFYYHPSLLKGERLRLLGPSTVSVTANGAVGWDDYVWLGYSGGVLTGNVGNSSADTVVSLGHIRGPNPYLDLACDALGVTHNDAAGTTYTARVYGKIQGSTRADSGPHTIPNPELDESGRAELSMRGNYLEPELTVAGGTAWSMGPLWLDLKVEDGGHG